MPAKAKSLFVQTGFRQGFIYLLLGLLTLAAFWPVIHLGFTSYDDQEYVVKNPQVQAGFSYETLRWAFTTSDTGNWHPVTWLSHILDCDLFGLNPSGPHGMNLGLHMASVALLYLVLSRMTGSVWRSALVAAFFAVHPLRVESVAWVSERKDVLSVFFMMLTLWAWVSYIEVRTGRDKQAIGDKKTSGQRWQAPWLFYSLALIFFALGLMSKPMLVTLPIILLLLDYWPLGRAANLKKPHFLSTHSKLVWEKLPFFLLVLGSCWATFQAQNAGGSVVSLSGMPLAWRMENMPVNYVAYLGKIFWPENLAVLYPIHRVSTWETLTALAILISATIFCLWRFSRQPYFFVGWCWFIIMLVPVIGLVQVGKESMADRYTYLPSIGILILLVWGIAEISAHSKFGRVLLSLVAVVLVFTGLAGVRRQVSYWQNDTKLFSHAIEVAPLDNYEGYLYLGNAYVGAGNLEAAVHNYQTSLQIDPEETTHLEQAHYNLGCVRFAQKHFSEAETEFGEAAQLDDNNVDAHTGLGRALKAQKKYTEAAAEFATAQRLNPNDDTINKELAAARLLTESDIALTHFLQVLKEKPTAETQVQVANILTLQGDYQTAADHYSAALQLQPDSPDVLNNLAWLLVACPDAQVRNGTQAIKYAERASELTHHELTRVLGTLAAAYAEAGRFDEAVATAQKACALAKKNGETDLLQKNEELLNFYRKHRTYFESTRQ